MEFVLAVIILIVLFYCCLRKFTSKAKSTIFLFYRNGCGWCEKLKPEWRRFEKMHKDSTDVEIRAINSEENAEMANEYGTQGVPHIVKECGGIRTVYQGNRSAEDLYKFSNER